MNIQAALTGGNPRTLGNTEQVVAYVNAHPQKLGELFKCLKSTDEIVRMRTGDALEKICREQPEWFGPYIDSLLSDVAAIDQPSVQWHLAQMIGELPLNETQRRRALEVLKRNLETASDWIVLNYSLETFTIFTRKDASLQKYFIERLKVLSCDSRKSVAKRASKLLLEFEH